MSSTQPPFSAATSKLAYAQAYSQSDTTRRRSTAGTQHLRDLVSHRGHQRTAAHRTARSLQQS